MWNHSKSLTLSVLWVRAALVLWAMLLLGLPVLYNRLAIQTDGMLLIFYVCYGPILVALWSLDRLLHQIAQGNVFLLKNVAQLRRISWCCFFAAVWLLVCTLLYWWCLLLSGAIGFFGLLMRVMKNMLSEAIVLKEEQDFTI